MKATLHWKEDDGITYLLAKNPTSGEVRRNLGKDDSRIAVGWYGDNSYNVLVENDRIEMMKRAREANLPAYLSSAPYVMSPKNLRGLSELLKSAIRGDWKDGSPLCREQVTRARDLMLDIGPVVCPEPVLREMYSSAGLSVVECRSTDDVHAVKLASDKFSLSEFLQRFLIVSYSISISMHDEKSMSDGLIESLIKMSSWLGDVDSHVRERIMGRITRGRAELLQKFRDSIEDDDSTEDDPGYEVTEERVGFHKLRHLRIVEAIEAAFGDDVKAGKPVRVVDLGCGEGKLWKLLLNAFPTAVVHGMEADDFAWRKATRGVPRNRAKFTRTNILTPYLEESDLKPDVLVSCEVIEHLSESDRFTMMRQVARMWLPKLFILTTPNSAYNHNFGLTDGEFRHKDHRIEFDADGLGREVLRPLRDNYDVELVKLDDSTDEQVSFIVVATRKGDPSVDYRPMMEARGACGPVVMEDVSYTVYPSDVRNGTTHPVYRHHLDHAFFLSPTVAPVDHDPDRPNFLEHPSAAYEYYKKRGIASDEILVQIKEMGSRCTLLIFRTVEAAREMGYRTQVVATSRSGYPFFNDDDLEYLCGVIPNQINWNNIGQGTQDFVVLDSEALPWSYKAKELIRKEFEVPAAVYLTDAVMRMDEASRAEGELLRAALGVFTKERPISIRVFAFLAYGKVKLKTFYDVAFPCEAKNYHVYDTGFFGGTYVNAPFVCSEVMSAIPGSYAESVADVIRLWEDHTTSVSRSGVLLEGFVVKPLSPRVILPDGAPVQPAVKVRGREYLRMIYGPDYLRPEMLRRLVRRDTKAKRALAMREHSLSRRILHTFFKGMKREHAQMVAAFLGMDGSQGAEIDKTL